MNQITQEKFNRYMYLLTKTFNLQKAKKKEIVIQFVFKEDDDDYNYFLQVNKKNCIYNKGIHNNPKLTIYSSFENWKKLSGNFISPITALTKGLVKYKGSFLELIKLGGYFSGNKDYNIPSDVNTYNKKIVNGLPKIKKVLVISGSPRKENGITNFFFSKYLKGMCQEGVEVEEINISDKKIHFCDGCFDCFFGKRVCRYKGKDDFDNIFNKFIKSDFVLFASPVYSWSFTTQLKAFIDRLFCIASPELFLRKRDKRVIHGYKYSELPMLGLFSVCALPYRDVFKPLQMIMKNFSDFYDMPLISEIYIPYAMTFLVKDIYNKNVENLFNAIEDAGKEIAKNNKIKKRTLKILNKNIFSDEILISGGNAVMELLDKNNKRPNINITNWF